MASRRLGGSTVGTDILSYDEKSQAQSFLKEFFAVFGVDIVLFNTFEHRVKFGDGSQGYADKAYGLKPTTTDSDRVALLFRLYAEKANMVK